MHSGSKYAYLPISDSLFHDGFYVIGGGTAEIRPGESYPPHGHPALYDFQWDAGRMLPEFQIVLITSGEGEFQQRGMPVTPVSSGSAILSFPGVWHRYRPKPEKGWTEKWLQFNGEFAHILQKRQMLSAKQPNLRPDRFNALDREFTELLEMILKSPSSNSLGLSLRALAILSRLIEEAQESPSHEPHPSRTADPVVAAALKFIWTNHHRTISVSDVAQHAAVNRRTLERRFSNELGRGMLDQIIDCRFYRAERLLLDTKLSVKAIVSLSGFGAEETMRKTFLKRTNLSPTDYRKAKLAQK